ncbi:copper amine oxidase N-terminal domain-containing protein [Paenibacillus albiflavus]|nr:copper amine oxidase N-terminal domain-containing protein [Paenibacillus albiflavus]
MKNTFKKIIPTTMLATMLCTVSLPAIAAETEALQPISAPISSELNNSVTYIYGSLTKLESGQFMLENSNDNALYKKIILNVTEDTLILDAVKGTPVKIDDVQEGQIVYAYIGITLALSEPPMANAELILCNIPADFGVPSYHEITSVKHADDKTIILTTNDNETVNVSSDIELTPYLTKNIVTTDHLIPGSKILVWKSNSMVPGFKSVPTKIMLFPYSYRGYLELATDGGISINGEELKEGSLKAYQNADGITMLPLRAISDALDLTVGWDNDRSAVTISKGDHAIFDTIIGTETATVAGESVFLQAKTETVNGSTFISAPDLKQLLNIVLPTK